MARRAPFHERHWGRFVAVHVPASLVVTAVVIAFSEIVLTYGLKMRPAPVHRMLAYAFGANFQSSLPTYWMILLGYLSWEYYVRFRRREIRAAQLEARLTEARLTALKMQLRPHFLFNTLNSISTLMYEDVPSANAMLSRLAQLLRATLDADRKQLVPLGEELELVQQFLEIEQIRLDERLSVRYEIDPRVPEAMVPFLLLQPIVENAIHHGIAPTPEGGEIVIRAAPRDSRLELQVVDNGPGMSRSLSPRVGLGNTQARLQQLFGDDFTLALSDSLPRGVTVTIVLPLRYASDESLARDEGVRS